MKADEITIRKKYKLLVRYRDVIAIGRAFGWKDWTVRKMLEGERATIKKHHLMGTSYAFYLREAVIAELHPNPYYCAECGQVHAGPCGEQLRRKG